MKQTPDQEENQTHFGLPDGEIVYKLKVMVLSPPRAGCLFVDEFLTREKAILARPAEAVVTAPTNLRKG